MNKKITISGDNNQFLNVGGNLNLKQQYSGTNSVMDTIFGNKNKHSQEQLQHRVLFFSANQSSKQLQFELEWGAIEQTVTEAKFREQFHLHQLSATTPQLLVKKIAESNPNIIQFSGHSNKTQLLLRNAQSLDAQTFSQLLKLSQSPVQCLVLNSCYSLTFANSLSTEIPNIIAMKSRIKDSEARTFIAGFYQGLGAGKDFTQAFEHAKVQMYLENCQDIDAPTLI